MRQPTELEGENIFNKEKTIYNKPSSMSRRAFNFASALSIHIICALGSAIPRSLIAHFQGKTYKV